jgi:hypothetical protein
MIWRLLLAGDAVLCVIPVAAHALTAHRFPYCRRFRTVCSRRNPDCRVRFQHTDRSKPELLGRADSTSLRADLSAGLRPAPSATPGYRRCHRTTSSPTSAANDMALRGAGHLLLEPLPLSTQRVDFCVHPSKKKFGRCCRNPCSCWISLRCRCTWTRMCSISALIKSISPPPEEDGEYRTEREHQASR